MHTTYDLVWYASERTPDHIAIVDDRTARKLTYRQLMLEIDKIAPAEPKIATILK